MSQPCVRRDHVGEERFGGRHNDFRADVGVVLALDLSSKLPMQNLKKTIVPASISFLDSLVKVVMPKRSASPISRTIYQVFVSWCIRAKRSSELFGRGV